MGNTGRGQGVSWHNTKSTTRSRWVFVEPKEGPFQIHARSQGSSIVLNFPPEKQRLLTTRRLLLLLLVTKMAVAVYAVAYTRRGHAQEGIAAGTRWKTSRY